MKQLLMVIPIVVLLLVAFSIGPWLLLYFGLLLEEDPPKPVYTYGEFPFYFEYENNGQTIIVEDTVIVEYDGIGLSEGTGKYIKWRETLASGREDIILYEDGKSVKIILDVSEGNGKHYLEDGNEIENDSFPGVEKEVRNGKRRYTNGITKQELFNDYNIELIKFEYGLPLKK